MSTITLGDWKLYEAGKKAAKGIIVIHEIFGFNQYIASVADSLAKAGYKAIAVDLFKGKVAKSLEEGMKFRSEVTNEDLNDCIGRAEKKMREDGVEKVGVLGFCMGGGFALQSACNLNIDYCIDYYGLIQNEGDVERLKGPLLIVLASNDERVTMWALQKLLPATVRYQKKVELHLYPNTVHAFHRPGWQGYNKEAADDAWERTLDFIRRV
ncbi:MAG: dienelactone hydrolase family protein [Conexivisphaerales archaeon]